MVCTAANSVIPGLMLRNSAFKASEAITAPNSNCAICSISFDGAQAGGSHPSAGAFALTTLPSGPNSPGAGCRRGKPVSQARSRGAATQTRQKYFQPSTPT